MSFERAVMCLLCTALLLLALPSTSQAQDSYIRVTMSSPWGHTEIVSITQTPDGAVVSKEQQHPRSVSAGAPATSAQRGELTISPQQYTAFRTQMIDLGVTQLKSFVQPNIEDAATYYFVGELDGTPFEFSVYGVPADLEDQSYFQIIRAMRTSAGAIEMKEVPR